MESVEDVPAKSINSGISWNWESYGEYLRELDSIPKGIKRRWPGPAIVPFGSMPWVRMRYKTSHPQQMRSL